MANVERINEVNEGQTRISIAGSDTLQAADRNASLTLISLRGEWRQLGRLVVDSCVAGLVVSLALALAVFIVTTPAHAAPVGDAPGTLYLKEGDGGRVASPLLFTDVQIDVSGMTARVQVKQRFVNPTAQWREGVYVFPLPDKAAVDHLQMRIGERVIEGMIKERGEAKRTYEAAKSEGRKTTLVEQERPNMFTTSVANIGPNEEIVVAIEYQEALRYDDGTFRLRFPLAITPRYIPGAPVESGGGMGWSPATQQVLDADRITPPVADRHEGYVNPVRIAVDLQAGFPLAKLASTYHPMQIDEQPGHRFRLTLADGPVPAARDFELAWTPDTDAAPGAALFTETKGGKTYALLMALPPPAASATAARMPREVTYIVDTSGSMEGVSIIQAREALLMALDRLQAGDSFNVIEFNSISAALFPAPVPLDAQTLRSAKNFVAGLRARGGTEMLPALKAALAGARESTMMRQVVFLTDGAVGNEDEILRLVGEQVSDRRLFTVGIGPAPNTFFMTRAAQFGRGTFTYIGDVREVKEKMTALFRKLENPALTDIAVDWPAGADVWPRVVPDLYAGEPVVVSAQFNADAGSGNIAVSGRQGGASWGMVLPAGTSAGAPGVGVLWARAKIDALMDAGRRGAPEPEIRTAVIDVALTHHLVSKFTSLVAVDVTPTRPAGVAASTAAIPGNIPEGLTGFDQLPRTATPAPLLLAMGAVALLLAAMLAWRMRGAGVGAAAMVALLTVAAFGTADADAQARKKSPPPRNVLLLPGHYDGDVGSLQVPLADTPDTGWFVLVKDAAGSYLRRIPDAAGARPLFLRELELATADNSATLQSALGQLFYLNMPRAALREGPVVEVPLRRRALVPVNGKSYALALGATPFSLTVNNGIKGRAGAHYVIEVGSDKYEYLLDGFGWDSEVQYAGDLDRDGKPDLVVYVNGNNSGTWFVLLSSQSKPGMNAPTAQLTAVGC
jgi:Ca-activated chloride channel family protein